MSDHGFSTVEHWLNVIVILQKAGSKAGRESMLALGHGDTLVAGKGSSVLFYVIGQDIETTRKLEGFCSNRNSPVSCLLATG